MSDIFRRKQPGEAWETAVVSSGGGGSPGGVNGDVQYNNAGALGGIQQSLFDVDPTTGAVTISTSDPDEYGLMVNGVRFGASDTFTLEPGISFSAVRRSASLLTDGSGDGSFVISDTNTADSDGDGIYWVHTGVEGGGKAQLWTGGTKKLEATAVGLGFFAATPVAKPTGVPVTAAGVHAALVTLGLISA